jgi:anti-anti-sigma factor
MASSSRALISITVVQDGDRALLIPDGELDRTSAADLDDRLDMLIESGCLGVTVDLSRISFADVSGYRALARFSERCARDGVHHVWVRPSGPVQRLWSLLGVPGGTTVDRMWWPFTPAKEPGENGGDASSR